MTGFTFGKYRGRAGQDLKRHLTESGETFDIIGVEPDLSADGHPIYRMHILFGDAEHGLLFWGSDPDDERTQAIQALRDAIEAGEVAAQPAVIRTTRTRAGRDYYWLEDPA